ncbi:MAG TPA: class E sortase [Acidimicrobiales bacterium]|nr:class E sortase [Acidimicrobiales bacterium]
MTWSYERGRSETLRRRRAPSVRAVVGGTGKFLIGAGVLVLLFVVYLLWGTDVYTSQHQNSLKTQICHELQHAKACGSSSDSSTINTTPSSSTTTTATSGGATTAPGAVPPEGQPVGILQIPKIGLDIVIVEGTSTADLELGPGHYPGTPLPGQPGNAAVAGHRTTYLHPFYNLNEMALGDLIYITTPQRPTDPFIYRVNQAPFTVQPNDTSVIAASTRPELTLTTCNPRYSATQRLVVQAWLVSAPATVPLPARGGSHSRSSTSSSSGLAGEQGSWVGTFLWGAAGLLIGTGIWMTARRRRRPWATYGLGVVPLLVVIFFFFENVSPLLPASF